MFGFPRRDFLKTLAWLFGASQVPAATAQAAADATASSTPTTSAQASPPGVASMALTPGQFDLIVVGGGLSGTAAAISAARNGVKVALVHDRSMLGGNSSSEVRLYPEATDAHQPWIRESGIHEEFHLEDRVRNHVRYREGLTNCHWDLVLYEWCIREPNLTLFLNTHMHAVKMASPSRIRAIHAIQIGTEKMFELTAPLFVDATGDGVLGYRAGADFRWGREAQNEYGESLAPEQADEAVMGNTLFFRAVDTGKPVPFVRPEWAAEFPKEEDLKYRNHTDLEAGHWWIEVGAPHHPIHGNEVIRHELLRQLLGVWDHVKNKGDHKAENYALEFVGFWPYKREARRIIGDAVLTQQHVQDPRQLDDAVAYGAWGIDLHFPGGILQRDQRPYIPPHQVNYEKFGTLPYGIGLRSMYSRNVENLFTCGRPISASYLAFCSSRVLSTGLICGQAIGVAAGLAKKYSTSPRQVATDYAKECQQILLRQDAHIPGVENEDPKDLARSASAAASSDAPLEWPEPKTGLELTFPRAQLFPVSGNRIDTISLWLASRRDQPFEMQIGLRAAPQVWDFRSTEDLATAKATIPSGHKGWVEFTFNKDVEPRKLYWVHTPVAPQILWRAIEVPRGESHATPPGCAAGLRMGATRWEALQTGVCFGLKVTPTSRPFAADNVIRGTHRPDKWSNIWISDPSQALPQHVELAWKSPQSFNTVLLTFDTNQGRRENAPLFRYPDCVKHYDLQARVNRSWTTIAESRGNYMRRREHRFDRVSADALRLNVLATNGAKSARVYEIRVYDEA
jgi:hypothetical protein